MRISVFKATDIALCIAMVGAAAFTYVTKHEAEDKLSEIREIQRKIVFEKDTIDVLKADWALLTQPNRIQALVERFNDELKLDNVEAYQIGAVGQLPMRPLSIDDIVSEMVVEAEGLRPDRTVTGGIAR